LSTPEGPFPCAGIPEEGCCPGTVRIRAHSTCGSQQCTYKCLQITPQNKSLLC
jgi:hypothetical protein